MSKRSKIKEIRNSAIMEDHVDNNNENPNRLDNFFQQNSAEIIGNRSMEQSENENEDVESDGEAHEERKDDSSSEIGDDEPIELPSRRRRFSLGRIPVPPEPMNLIERMKISKVFDPLNLPAEPRKLSATLDVYKDFKESNANKYLNDTIHVETRDGRFKVMKKSVHLHEQRIEREKAENREKMRQLVIPSFLTDVAYAYSVQKTINRTANIVQGFVAGVSVTLSVFSFNFGPEVLLRSYRWMCLPLHALFMVAFSFGFFTAVDRIEYYKNERFSRFERFKQTIADGFAPIFIWTVGLISTLICIEFDTNLALVETTPQTEGEIIVWRTLCVIRAVAASMGWLIIAFKPDSDSVSRQLKDNVIHFLNDEGTNKGISIEKRENILKAMDMN